jgi:hypothetical protein
MAKAKEVGVPEMVDVWTKVSGKWTCKTEASEGRTFAAIGKAAMKNTPNIEEATVCRHGHTPCEWESHPTD